MRYTRIVDLDALVVKMREEGTVQNPAVYVAVGITMEGHKEVLGLRSSVSFRGKDTEQRQRGRQVLAELSAEVAQMVGNMIWEKDGSLLENRTQGQLPDGQPGETDSVRR